MTILQSIFLGILQGIAEFLPVSSSGHLVLARTVMGLEEIPALFDVILHLATLIVVLWVFRQRVGAILAALGRFCVKKTQDSDRPQLILAMQILAASAITAAIGFGVEALDFRADPRMVSSLLIVTALILLLSARAAGTRNVETVGWKRFLLLGAAQGLGVFPGISRSGITIGTGLFCGLDRQAAGEISFLLSLPAVGGAFLLTLKDAGALGQLVPFSALVAGFVAALVAGYAALRLLLWLIADGRLWTFALYLIPMGFWGLWYFR